VLEFTEKILRYFFLSACAPINSPPAPQLTSVVQQSISLTYGAPTGATVDVSAQPTLTLRPEETPPVPQVSRFEPFDPTGMIALSGNGLELIDPATQKVISLFPRGAANDPFALFPGGFSWSTDGRKLAFQCRRQDGHGYLLLADFTTGEIRPLVNRYAVYSVPIWSPNGQNIAYVEKRADVVGDLFVLSLAIGQRQLLSDRAHWYWQVQPAWLDDESLAFLYQPEEGLAQGVSLVRQVIGEQPIQVLVSGEEARSLFHFAFSPDRTALIYLKSPGIYFIANPGSENATTEFLGLSHYDVLLWSPDGKTVLVQEGEGAKWLLDIEILDGLKELEVVGVVPASLQSWSPDSKRLIMFDPMGEKSNVIIYHVENRQINKLPVEVQYPFDASWNPIPSNQMSPVSSRTSG